MISSTRDANNPPQRVGGSPPFYAATGMVAGTAANTVIWYTGETGTDSGALDRDRTHRSRRCRFHMARAPMRTASATLVQNVATLAAVQISPEQSEWRGPERRLGPTADGQPGCARHADHYRYRDAISPPRRRRSTAAKTRHQQTSATLNDFLQQIDGVSNEEVGAQLLTLQTRMQASMQVTSMLFQTSLVNYIK